MKDPTIVSAIARPEFFDEFQRVSGLSIDQTETDLIRQKNANPLHLFR